MPETSHKPAAYVAVTLATVLWGLSHVLTKFIVAEFIPVAVVAIRITAAALIMISLQKLRGRTVFPLILKWKQILPLGFAGIFVSQFGFVLGLSYTKPEHGALIYTLSPIITALLAMIFRGDRIRRIQFAGIGIAFTGAALLITGGGVEINPDYLLGDLIMLGAATGWSYYTVFSKEFIGRNGTMTTLMVSFIYAVPFAWLVGLLPALNSDYSAISMRGWLSLAYLVILATVLTVYLFTYSLKYLRPATAAVFVYLQPVVTSIGAFFLLDEPLTPIFLVSASLVFTGLCFFTFHNKISPERD